MMSNGTPGWVGTPILRETVHVTFETFHACFDGNCESQAVTATLTATLTATVQTFDLQVMTNCPLHLIDSTFTCRCFGMCRTNRGLVT